MVQSRNSKLHITATANMTAPLGSFTDYRLLIQSDGYVLGEEGKYRWIQSDGYVLGEDGKYR